MNSIRLDESRIALRQIARCCCSSYRCFVLSATFLVADHYQFFTESSSKQQLLPNAPVYVGVTYCGDNVTEAKLLIDKVKNYTNLFVIQSGPLQKNLAKLNEICTYAVASGLHIIVYFGSVVYNRNYLTVF